MRNEIKRLCVFCGSGSGNRIDYADAAQSLGQELLNHNIELIYGGGHIGLMGILADTVMQGGGHVIGIIPGFLAKREIAHNTITELRVVGSMHERKALMAELADGFIAMPGGIGTFEELMEAFTWNQLGIQTKPCAILNTCNYFEHMLAMLDHAVEEQFLRRVHRDMLLISTSAAEIIELIQQYKPVTQRTNTTKI